MKKWLNLFKQTYTEWSEDNCARLGASLSYYTLGSLIPLLLIVTSIVSFFLNFTGTGQDAKESIINYMTSVINNPAFAEQLTNGLTGANESQSSGSIIGTIVGVVSLLFAASGVFGELDAAFNIIWDVPADQQPKGVWGFIRSKFFSFTLVLGVAFLLLVSLVITSTLNGFADTLNLTPAWLFSILNFFVQIGVISLVFALLFKYLPDTQVEWRDVLIGGVLTAVLWTVGQYLLTFYFTLSSSFSSYGIIGGVLAFLVYVYYSSQILFFGGEFTQVYARTHGSRSADQPAAQGISHEATLMVQAATVNKQRQVNQKEQELAAAKTRQYAAATTGGLIGLVAGALIGGIGVVTGVARGVARLRR
jgi:membrane protein